MDSNFLCDSNRCRYANLFFSSKHCKDFWTGISFGHSINIINQNRENKNVFPGFFIRTYGQAATREFFCVLAWLNSKNKQIDRCFIAVKIIMINFNAACFLTIEFLSSCCGCYNIKTISKLP